MKRITAILTTLLILPVISSVFMPLSVYAGTTPTPAPAAGGGSAGGSGSAIEDIKKGAVVADPGGSTVNNAVRTGITLFSWLVGVVSVIMIIFGGFKFITGAGDAAKYAEARRTIIYALIGLSLVVVSQVIVRAVIVKSTALPKAQISPNSVVGV